MCRQLQRIDSVEEECLKFSDKVYCQSYSSKMDKSTDDFLMGIPHAFSMYLEHKETDGMVPVDSCIFGEYKGYAVDDSVSHSEIIGFIAKAIFGNYNFYITLCNDLMNQGF